jgi:hypothetical protein
MNRLIRWLTNSGRGTVVLGDYALVASVLILGSVVGLILVRNALLGEAEVPSAPPAHSSVVTPGVTP